MSQFEMQSPDCSYRLFERGILTDIMFVIDLSASQRKALGSGFMKGLGAPFILYGHFDSSAVIPDVTPVVPATGASGLAGDWKRIGQDMRSAIRQYGQEASTTTK